MKIDYVIALGDVTAWHRHYITIPKVARALRKRGISTAAGVSLFIFAFFLVGSKDPLIALIPAGVMFLVICAMIGSALRHEALKRLRKSIEADPTSLALGPHTLEITPETITEVSQHRRLTVQWDIVRGVATTTDHIFILLNDLSVFIIPQRAFHSCVERAEFIQHVKQLIPSHAPVASDRNLQP